jgi:hypothetical protein
LKSHLPLVDVITHICDALPKGLHESVGQPRLTQVSHALPPFMALAGLEFRLADNNAQIDIGIAYSQADAVDLARFLTDAVATEPAFSDNGWLQILSFALTWSCLPDAAHIQYITIEIDIPALLPTAPVPMVSFFMDDTHPFNGARVATAHILSMFNANELHRALTGRLWSCINALHPTDTWRGIGLMTNRCSEGVRLLLKMHRARVLPYLRTIGWRGPVDAVAVGLGALSSAGDEVTLYIDVGRDIGNRVGIGLLFLGNGRRFDGYSQKLKVLSLLVANGLCSAEKARAFQSLHKRPITAENAVRPWPSALTSRATEQVPHHLNSQFLHVAMAVKISYQGDLEPEAKLYSAISHHWLF